MIMSSIGIRRRFFAVIARVSELVNLHSSSQTPEACSLLIGSLRSQSSTRGCLRLYCREAHLTSTQIRDNWNSLLIGRRSQSTVCSYKRIDRQCGTIPSEIVAGSEAEDAVESQESPPVRIENREAVIDDDEEDIWAPGSTRAKINLVFVLKDGSRLEVKAPVGRSLLEVAHHYSVDIEGACESSLACSTCHVILDDSTYNKLPCASEREDDLLDMAPHLSETSRLSCQVILSEELNGMVVKLPPSTLNFYVDGHVPKPP